MSQLNINGVFFASYNIISSSENEGQHGFSMPWLRFHVPLAHNSFEIKRIIFFNSVIEASTWIKGAWSQEKINLVYD